MLAASIAGSVIRARRSAGAIPGERHQPHRAIGLGQRPTQSAQRQRVASSSFVTVRGFAIVDLEGR